MRKTRRRLVMRGEFVGESVSPDITISAAHVPPTDTPPPVQVIFISDTSLSRKVVTTFSAV